MGIPEGWTDDMRVSLAPGKTVAELVSLIMNAIDAGKEPHVLMPVLTSDFGMTIEEVHLAFDRVPGGIVRTLTGNLANRPDRTKDPLAYESLERVWRTLSRRGLFSSRRTAAGPWRQWFEGTLGRSIGD